MKQKFNNLDFVICIVIGSLLAVVYQLASRSPYNQGDGMWHGLNFNLAVYVGSLAAAFLLYVVFTAASGWIIRRFFEGEDRRFPRAGLLLYPVYTAAAAALCILIYEIYDNECNLYPATTASTYLRQEVSHPLYFALIAAIAAAFLFACAGRGQAAEKNRRLRIAAILLFAVLNAIALYCPNIFNDRAAGVPHIHAVTNSMVNVAKFAPYDAHNLSIYGHYALICLPFVKLLGGDLLAVMQTLALMGFFSYAAAFYVADRLIRRDSVFLMAVISITGTTTILTRRGQYFQINPLRLLFPMLTLAVIAFTLSRKRAGSRRTSAALLTAVGIGSVIWNFETGLFCVAVLMCVSVFRALSEAPVFSLKTLAAVLRAVLFGVVCIAGAYGIVSIYNFACGGGFNSFRLFIYPFRSGNYDYNHLRVELPSVVYLYFFQILLFFFTAVTALGAQVLKKEGPRMTSPGERERTLPVLFAISLSGLSSLIYFINRAAYGNMAISHIQMCLLLACFGENALSLSREKMKKALRSPAAYFSSLLSVILFGCSLWLAIEGALYIPVSMDYRATSSWKLDTMSQGLEDIKEKVPRDTFAIGFCIPELYQQLGWENALVMIDWSDINDLNSEYAYQEAEKHNYVLVGDIPFKSRNYKKTATVATIDPYEYRLYERIEKLPGDESSP